MTNWRKFKADCVMIKNSFRLSSGMYLYNSIMAPYVEV